MSRNLLLYDEYQIKKIKKIRFKLSVIFQRYLQEITFKNSSKIIFLSKHAKNIVLKKFEFCHSKSTTIIHHGADNYPNIVNRKHRRIEECNHLNPFKILYISPFYAYKNHENLIKAVQLIAENFEVQLTLIGDFPDKKSKEKFNRLFQQLNSDYQGLIQHIENIPPVEVYHYYYNSDLFVFPSSTENMPNILLEAMSTGIPIAASNIQPMPEFLEEAGLYFNPEDVEDLYIKMTELIVNENLRNELSKISVDIAGKYSWKNTSKQTFKALTTLKKADVN